MSLSLVRSRFTEDFYLNSYDWLEFGYFYGIEEALRRLGFSFQVLSDEDLRIDILKNFSLLILPEVNCLSDEASKALAEYVLQGGKILAIGRVGQRYEDGRPRKDLSSLEAILGIEARTSLPMEASYWPWWDCRFTLRLTESGAKIMRSPEQTIFVYMDYHPPRFSEGAEVLAKIFKEKSRFKGICAHKWGKGIALSIVFPLGQIVYDYLKDHRYAFYGSIYQTDMPRRFFYPIEERDPKEGIELSCTYLWELLQDAVVFLMGSEDPWVKKALYPDGAEGIVVATHDYDAFGEEQVKVYRNLQGIHQKHGIRTTHYFMADVYRLDSEEIRRIFEDLRQRKDEIGLHTTRHREPYSLEHMKDEMKKLEEALGMRVHGESLHGSLSISDDYRKARATEIPVLASELGFDYARDARDSRGIVPASDGVALCFPYRYPKTSKDGRVKALNLFNIPVMFTDAHHVRMGLSKEEILASIIARFEATMRHKGVFCFVAHPHYDRLPDEKYSSIYESFIEHTKGRRVKWWTALDLSRWEKAFDEVSIGRPSWDGERIMFFVDGPKEALEFGKVTLEIYGKIEIEEAMVEGKLCMFERGDGFWKIMIERFGLLSLKVRRIL